MGFRYRKSVKLGGLRINFSKSGVGYSYGIKGLRHTKTATGREHITASIPGTGISYVTESGKKTQRKKRTVQPVQQQPAKNYKIPLALKILAVLCGIGFAAYYYFGQGREISLAIGSGAVMGGLSYLGICILYGAVAGALESVLHKDILSEKDEQRKDL